MLVEIVDSKVFNLVCIDIIWYFIFNLIEDVLGKEMFGFNMVEYNSNDLDEIKKCIVCLEEEFMVLVESGEYGVIGYQFIFDKVDINKIYVMCKKLVGLLGNIKGS